MKTDEYWVPYFPGDIIEWEHVIVRQRVKETELHLSDNALASLTVESWPKAET